MFADIGEKITCVKSPRRAPEGPFFPDGDQHGDEGEQFQWLFRGRFVRPTNSHMMLRGHVHIVKTSRLGPCFQCFLWVLNEKMSQRGSHFQGEHKHFFHTDQKENALPDTHVQHTHEQKSHVEQQGHRLAQSSLSMRTRELAHHEGK